MSARKPADFLLNFSGSTSLKQKPEIQSVSGEQLVTYAVFTECPSQWNNVIALTEYECVNRRMVGRLVRRLSSVISHG